MPSSRRPPFLLLFIASIIVYSAAWLALGSFEKRAVPEDFNHRYLPIAHGILERGDFLLDGRAPSPPLYPLALAGLSKMGTLFRIGEENAAKAFNVLAMALVASLFYALVRRYTNGRTALAAAFVWITYPFGIYLALQPGPEPLYLLFLLLAAWAALEAGAAGHPRPFAALAAGMAGALPMLVKPVALFLPLALLGVLSATWVRRRVPSACFALWCSMFLVGLLAAVLPWEAYLWQRTGKLIPVADKAGNSIYDGWTFGLNAGAGGDRFLPPGDVEKYMIEVEKMSQGRESGEVLSSIVHSAKNRPRAFLKLMFIKMGRCWYGTDEMWHERLIFGIQAAYLVLSLLGAVVWFRNRRPGGLLVPALFGLLLYHWAAATAALSILRYMIPAGFLLAVMIGFAVGRAYRGWLGNIK